MKARHALVRDPLYKIRLHFWRGPERSMVAVAKKDGYLECQESDGAARTLIYTAKGYGQLVVHLWVAPGIDLRSPFGASCVAHEAVHAATAVWKRIGAPAPESGNDEPFAYYVEWLMREFLRRMAR